MAGITQIHIISPSFQTQLYTYYEEYQLKWTFLSSLWAKNMHSSTVNSSVRLSDYYIKLQDGTGLKQLQQADPDIGTMLDWSISRPPRGQVKGSSRWLQKLWTEYPHLSVGNGLLWLRVTSSLRSAEPLCLSPGHQWVGLKRLYHSREWQWTLLNYQ